MHLKRLWKDRRAAAIVEMTLVTPFLIFVGLGIAEFGQALYHQHLITTGLRDSARYLARFDDPLSAAADGRALAATGQITGGTNRVSWWGAGNVTVTVSNVANPVDANTGQQQYRGGTTINIVRVATNVVHPGLGFLSLLGITSPLRINVSHEERVIGD